MKSKIIKVISVLLAVLIFMFFTVASGSDSQKATENPGSTDAASPTSSGSDTASTPTSKPTSAPKDEEKVEYTVTDTGVRLETNSLNSTYVSVYVAVKNTGTTNLYLDSSSIDIEYADGTLAQTIKLVSVYPQVIEPGETAHYYEKRSFDGDIEKSEGLKVVHHVKAEKAKVDRIRLNVTEAQIKDDKTWGAKLTGRVENNTGADLSSVYVVVDFFDKEGKLICQQFTILSNDLKAGDKVGFETSNLYDRVNADDIGSYEVYAYPYQFQF